MAGFKCVTILFMVPIYMPRAHIATDFLERLNVLGMSLGFMISQVPDKKK